MNNCPNCGAPFLGTICQYCGTTAQDIFNIKEGEPVFISWVYNNKKITVKLIPKQFEIETNPCTYALYADDFAYKPSVSFGSREISIKGDLISFDWDDISGVTYIIEKFKSK